MELFAEALWAIRLPCTLALLVPGFVPLVGGRRNGPAAVLFYILAAGVVFWLRSVGWFFDQPSGWISVAAGIGIAAVAFGMYRLPGAASAMTGGALIGAVSAWLWIPCVGTHLGRLLNRSGDQVWSSLPFYGIYVAGVCALLVVFASLPLALPKLSGLLDHKRLPQIGLGIGFVMAGVVGLGLYEDIVGQLLQWSLRIQ